MLNTTTYKKTKRKNEKEKETQSQDGLRHMDTVDSGVPSTCPKFVRAPSIY
jgi:hypothetical protein